MPATLAPLGEFEVVVLLAVLQRGSDAYGSAIREEIERRSGRAVSRGAVYITLDRLEDKGLLVSRAAPATGKRGGRQKRVFKVTHHGTAAIKRSIALVSQMRKGLEPLLGDL